MRVNDSAKDAVLAGILCAVLFAAQLLMSQLPNIEAVSLLIIMYTLHFRRITPYIIYVFVLLEGIIYGFHIWWISYLYVWIILYFIARIFSACDSPVIWALISGVFGLFFGALCSLPYLFAGGPGAALSYFIAGIPYDLLHCAGNFTMMLVFYRPLKKILFRRQYQ